MNGTANRVVPVSFPPLRIAGADDKRFQVINVGDNTVYLGQNSSVSENVYGIPLSAGSSIYWEGDSELWGVCKQGERSSLSILYTASGFFTPGPSTVNSLPGAVPEIIDEINLPFGTSPVFGNFAATASYDISQYTSVIIEYSCTGDGSSYSTGTTSGSVSISAIMKLGGFQTNSVSAYWYLIPTGFPAVLPDIAKSSRLIVPVSGDTLELLYLFTKSASPSGGDIKIRILGSHTFYETPVYYNQSHVLAGDDKLAVLTRDIALGSTQVWINSVSGAAILGISKTDSAGGGAGLINTDAGITRVAQNRIVPNTIDPAQVNGYSVAVAMTVGYSPISLQVAQLAGTGNLRFWVGYEQ